MKVASLHLYPLKSARGLAVDRVDLDAFGFRGDRRLLLVDAAGRFLTQRTEARLATLEVRLLPAGWRFTVAGRAPLEVVEPGSGAPAATGITLWQDTLDAADCGPEAAAWFTAWLQQPVRLVHAGHDFGRRVRKSPADAVAFADGYPLLVASLASLDDLNARLAEPVPMDRFRPNLVVEGCAPFAEDTWPRVRIGEVILRSAGPCARCIVTTTDQLTGERLGPEPLQTLARYRQGPEGGVNFGQNMIPESKSGRIHVGDPVEILG